ncbi:AraC family transcriptional regulator [Treponema brennaborense]|uniref:Transcriptional regulator, AraC family n=1 Tax=Treponema brennaborense (strain DSM 12168 / CIP 105900 / DD5/3) TaxID=906968 RepID=F4LLB9_TREBD|nr:GyrI-like domain-containing protein [Treponema brennaborense]AEE15597.1 transcriptional regulator, AraC family [Treponema brennaborense DSM 12168]
MITCEIVNKAIDFILANLRNDISVDDVAAYCGYSKFHFCRLFKTQTGESVYAFVKRMRMEQCAFRLKVERHRTVSDIGIDYGLSSSNFATLFREFQDTSPYYFRKGAVRRSVEHPFFHAENDELESFDECRKKITIEMLPDYHVVYERRKGNYHNLSGDWCAFIEKYGTYHTENSLLFERTYSDPSVTDADSCLYDICMEVPLGCPLENTCTLTGGKFAVYHFNGSPKLIFAAYQSVFNVWMPCTGALTDNRYGFDIYRNVAADASHMEIDLCIPIC